MGKSSSSSSSSLVPARHVPPRACRWRSEREGRRLPARRSPAGAGGGIRSEEERREEGWRNISLTGMCVKRGRREGVGHVFSGRGGGRFKNGSVLFVIFNRSKAAFALVRSVTAVTDSRAPRLRALWPLIKNNKRQEVAREPQRGEVAIQYNTVK